MCTQDAELWACDAEPNLLLAERSRSDLAARLSVSGVADEAVIAPVVKLSRLLEPLIAGVSASSRAILAGLIERGTAPSPFCTLELHGDGGSGAGS